VSLAVAVVDEVRKRMTRRHLSQRALAQAAGMPPTLLHRAMNGERVLTIDELAAVADVLKVTPEQLVRVAREGIARTPLSGECSEMNSESASD
jgi:transcriptional regulator with XRE-family HTH domain